MDVGTLNPFEYADYRKYLKDFYEHEKGRSSAFSHRRFAQRAKLSSPNYLKLVMDGSRSLSNKMLPHFVRGLRLHGPQADYFRHLVQHQESKDSETQAFHLSEMMRIRQKAMKRARVLDLSHHEVLRNWLNWTLREMALLPGFRCDPEWIAPRLRRKVSKEEIRNSLNTLSQLGLVTEDESGQVNVADPLITTGDDLTSRLLRNLHKEFMELALHSLVDDPVQDREFGGLTIALPRSRLAEFKNCLREFRKEMNRRFTGGAEANDSVYQLSMTLFPLTRSGEEL